jgi:hypothetical protein
MSDNKDIVWIPIGSSGDFMAEKAFQEMMDKAMKDPQLVILSTRGPQNPIERMWRESTNGYSMGYKVADPPDPNCRIISEQPPKKE